MNRRIFLGSAVAATGFASIGARAQVTPPKSERVIVTNTIANNHGHALVLSDVDVIKALRKTTPQTPVVIDIKGAGTHAHAVSLTKDALIQLLVTGLLELTSSVGSGHTHGVSVKLGVGVPTSDGVLLKFGNF